MFTATAGRKENIGRNYPNTVIQYCSLCTHFVRLFSSFLQLPLCQSAVILHLLSADVILLLLKCFKLCFLSFGTQLVDREGVVMAQRHSRVHPGDLEEGGGTGGPRRKGRILKATSGSNLTHQVCAAWFFIPSACCHKQ